MRGGDGIKLILPDFKPSRVVFHEILASLIPGIEDFDVSVDPDGSSIMDVFIPHSDRGRLIIIEGLIKTGSEFFYRNGESGLIEFVLFEFLTGKWLEVGKFLILADFGILEGDAKVIEIFVAIEAPALRVKPILDGVRSFFEHVSQGITRCLCQIESRRRQDR